MNTELRERYLATTETHVERTRDGARVFELNRAQVDAIAATVTAKLTLYEPTSQGTGARSGARPS